MRGCCLPRRLLANSFGVVAGTIGRRRVEAGRCCDCQATERRIGWLSSPLPSSFDIRHSSFTAHSAHSRNIISGTPEREWSEWDERHGR